MCLYPLCTCCSCHHQVLLLPSPSHPSWWLLWLDALFGPCCIQTSREGRHYCAPSTAHVAAVLKRPTWGDGDTHPPVVKISTAGLCSTFLHLSLTWRCLCSRPSWWSRVEDRSSLRVGDCDLWEERSHSHRALAGTALHLSDTALPYLSSGAKGNGKMWHEMKRGNNQLYPNSLCVSVSTLGQPDIRSVTSPLQ